MPFDRDDPFAPLVRRKRPVSVEEEFAGTELDLDPFAAEAVKQDRMSLSSLQSAAKPTRKLGLRDRLFNVSVPEQLMGDDESIGRFEEDLAGLPETLYPQRERDKDFSFPKAAAAEILPDFFGALRSAASPAGLAENVTGRVGRVASGAMAGEGAMQVSEGNWGSGAVNIALGALGALAGVSPKGKKDLSGPRPVPGRGPKPDSFNPRSTSPSDDVFADRVLRESGEMGADLRSRADVEADEILTDDLGLKDFDPRSGRLRDDIPFDTLVDRGYTPEQILQQRGRARSQMRTPPAEPMAGAPEPDPFIRQVQGEVVDELDPTASSAVDPMGAPADLAGPPAGPPAGSGVAGAPSGLDPEIAKIRRQLQRDGYPPALIDRAIAEVQAGRARDVSPRVETATPDADSLEDILGPLMEQEPAPANIGGTTPAGWTGPDRRGAGRLSPEDFEAEVARRRQTEIQERMQRGEMTLEDTIAKRPDTDMKAAGEAARAAQAEVEGRPKGRAGVDSGDGAPVRPLEGDRPPQRQAADGGGLDARAVDPDRAVGGGAPPNPRALQDEFFDELLVDARAQGYAGTDAELRSVFNDRSRSAQELIEDLTNTSDEFGPDALMREIRSRGGINLQGSTGWAGSKRKIADLENLAMDMAQKGNRGAFGAASPFRSTGVGLDAMAQSLAEADFPGITSMDDLIDVLERYSRTSDDAQMGWGAPGLREAMEGGHGVRTGRRWWEEGGDDAFEFGANAPDAGLSGVEDVLSTGEVQPRLDVPGARQAGRADTAFRAPQQASGSDFDLGNQMTPEARIRLEAETALLERSNLFGDEQANVLTPELIDINDPRVPQRPGLQAGDALEDVAQVIDEGPKLAQVNPDDDAVDTLARQLLGDNVPVSKTVAQAQPPNRIPANVRDFMVKQLGYTDEILAGMSPAEIYRKSRAKERNPFAAERPPAPKPVKAQPAGTPYPESLADSPIADDLEEFLGMEVPRRQAQAAERTERVRQTRGIPIENVNRVVDDVPVSARKQEPSVAPPITRRSVDRSAQVVKETTADIRASRVADKARVEETVSEAQSRKATMQGEQKRAGRDLDRAFDTGDYNGFATQLGEAVERFWGRQTKMGTAAADVRRGETGTVLESGLVPGFSMAAKVLNDPKKYAALSAEMLKNPAIRGLIGGITGYAVDDEEPIRGGLYGAILAAAGPSGARALKRSIENLRAGKPASVFQDPKNKDVARWRLAYGPSLEASVPDVFRKVREIELTLEDTYKGAWAPETKVATAKHTREVVGRVLADAAKEAKDAGLKRKGWLLEGYSRRYRGVPTVGQQNIQVVADTVFGKGKFSAAAVEKHANQVIHRTMIGYALDSAMQNLSQPTLALLHVSPKNLGRGWKLANNAAAKQAIGTKLDLPAYKGQDIISEADELITGTPAGSADTGVKGMLKEPGFPLRMTDEFNRRAVYLAALDRKGALDSFLKTGKVSKDVEEWALSRVRRTQGDPGALGKNPFHRGPVAGPMAAFQKYPGLFLENLADAFGDPDARGKAAVASLLGLVAAGHLLGIDVAEMYFSGARPLGIDPLHPADTIKRGLAAFPAARGVSDVIGHLTGSADHPFVGTPGTDFLDSDLAMLGLGRYPVKFLQKGAEVLSEGLGEHAPESVTDTRAPHSGLEDLMSLIGLKSERQTAATRASRDASRFRDRTQQEQRDKTRSRRLQLEDAIRSGDKRREAELRREMSPAQQRDYDRRRQMTPYQRRREQIPRDRRDEFDREFRDRLDR